MNRFFSSPLVIVVLLMLFVLSGMRLLGTFGSYRGLSAEEGRLREKLVRLESENRALREELRLLDTPEAIERDAKERLNLKKPEEKVVVVVPNQATTAASSVETSVWLRVWRQLLSFFQ